MKILYPLLLLLVASSLFAQPVERSLQIRKSDTAIKLDGSLDEMAWQTADVLTDFRRQFPVDTGLATARTELRMTFDDRYLYIGAVCFQKQEDYTIQSLKRDFAAGTSDVLNILFNPSKDGLNGFLFGVSPLNVQREALIDNGTTQSLDWDNRWESAVQNHDDRWVVEVAIPFKTLRYSVLPGENSWKMNFVRTRIKNWEVSTWQPVPQQFPPNNLAFTGILKWETPPPKPGANVALIPYVIGGYSKDWKRDPNSLEVREKADSWTRNVGGDAKIGITPSLNLDLTFNPDFSQVEVDQQVANLSRFELFFPERRQFFLENRDLFAMFGFPSTRPFFSRRIGLARNPLTGLNETVPIVAGARLSGKLTDDLRVGLLNMQTERIDWDTARALPAANFTMATLQRKVFGRSALSGVFVNKQNFLENLNESQRGSFQPWNRVAGLEYNLFSQDNRWEGEWYYHRSFSPNPKQRGQTFAQYLGYNDRHFGAWLGYMNVDSNYTAEAGFVPRVGMQEFYPGIRRTFYPKHKFINTWQIGVDGTLVYSLKFEETDRDMAAYIQTEFKDQTSISFAVYNAFTYLFEPFDPTNQNRPDVEPLPGDRGYTYSGAQLRVNSSRVYALQGSLDLTVGQFFNGNTVRAEGAVTYRWQPIGTLALAYSFNRIKLPEPYASADFWLLGPRAELSFSRNLFVSAFFQYNTQVNNFNINTRLQWRFAPVSDVFLVYTDNSFAEIVPNTPVRFFSPKNRALVLKVVYWLNV
ncbi:MAG: carbohydrate binding family 9 domain-containing protein [Saprospiraceae bacterium]|nr:carbohydrate binding family 9 domain-containing protein [Saprospiraceae bacterium]